MVSPHFVQSYKQFLEIAFGLVHSLPISLSQKKGPIHKVLAKQLMTPPNAPIYCGFGLLRWGRTDKSTMEGGEFINRSAGEM